MKHTQKFQRSALVAAVLAASAVGAQAQSAASNVRMYGVLDVGVSRSVDDAGKARLLGDVHPDVAQVAGWLSPNPGGVGPMTRAMLLANVVDTAERSL